MTVDENVTCDDSLQKEDYLNSYNQKTIKKDCLTKNIDK